MPLAIRTTSNGSQVDGPAGLVQRARDPGKLQQYDAALVSEARAALRGRLSSPPVDNGLLQKKGVDAVQAALDKQEEEANNRPPVAKSQRHNGEDQQPKPPAELHR